MPIIDVDAERSERAAARETTGLDPNGIRVGGALIPLPDEFPLDVLSPLLEVDLDLTSVISVLRDVVDQEETGRPVSNQQVAGAIADLFLLNKKLQQRLPEALSRCAHILMGDDGFATWQASRPTVNDYVVLARNLFTLYGVSLGEASASPDSSGDAGTTSTPTSSGSTGLTSGTAEGFPAQAAAS